MGVVVQEGVPHLGPGGPKRYGTTKPEGSPKGIPYVKVRNAQKSPRREAPRDVIGAAVMARRSQRDEFEERARKAAASRWKSVVPCTANPCQASARPPRPMEQYSRFSTEVRSGSCVSQSSFVAF
jgi:hypothetical protein